MWRPTSRPCSTLALLSSCFLMIAPVALAIAGQMIDNTLLRAHTYLESRYARAHDERPAAVDGIIVLGGSYSRVEEASRIAAGLPSAPIILTGGNFREVRRFAELGVAPPRLVIEEKAKNTFENALFSLRVAAPRADQRWLLITSAVHMPRAMAAFQTAGFDIEPWQVHDAPKRKPHLLAHARHEILANVAYRVMGRTSTLFHSRMSGPPGPSVQASMRAPVASRDHAPIR
jgi:uncharacterized SAM-binding protein YcdF (DUF218 family)